MNSLAEQNHESSPQRLPYATTRRNKTWNRLSKKAGRSWLMPRRVRLNLLVRWWMRGTESRKVEVRRELMVTMTG